MSSQPSEGSEERAQSSSSSPPITIHLFACGNGDTILLRIAGRWSVLIDCHLTERVHRRFFETVRDLGIKRLDVVCLSHPDHDHFRGMDRVVEHFTTEGRSIGYYCDSGVDPKQIRDLLGARDRDEASEYERLHRRLDKLIDDDRIEYRPLDENGEGIKFACGAGHVEIIPIGPNPKAVRKLQRIAAKTGRVSASLNAISSVLVLWAKDDTSRLSVLLGGDADATGDEARPGGLDRALDKWTQRCAERDECRDFGIAKVPHHGAWNGLADDLVSMRTRGESLALISVGLKYRAHPDRAVLRAYAEKGWRILATCCRREAMPPDSPLDLFARTERESRVTHVKRDIQLTWDWGGTVEWSPADCEIGRNELELYESCKAARDFEERLSHG
jgi:beta-lactamase superfamily II metal-dependent hydrolase